MSIKLWKTIKEPEPEPSVIEELVEEEAAGINVSSTPRGHQSYDPAALTPKMMHIMDVQFFNPTITTKQLAEVVELSPRRVNEIIGSGMYRAKYKLRRLKIERLQNSKIAEEREKFRKLRDEMIQEHKTLVETDETQHKGKELEVKKLKQRSISDLLRMSVDELRDIDRKLSPGRNNDGAQQMGAEIEVDTSDPKKAYVRLMAGFRRGTK